MDAALAKSGSKDLVRYEAACLALAKARDTDEVKLIRDKADAIRAAARIAKNKQLEVDAAEIRIRAERRLGEMLAETKATVGLNKGAKGSVVTGSKREPVKDDRPTLAAAGIDKKLSSRAQKLAAVPEAEFEKELGEWRERVSSETNRVTTKLEQRGEDVIRRTNFEDCPIPDSAILETRLTCPTCGQKWPEGRGIHE